MNNISITSRICALCAFALIGASLNGCYLLESAQGQLALMSKRRPIARVVADARTPADVRKQLDAVAQIREFAVRNLHLPDNGSYRTYADVGRPYVVWNVVAAPEFSVDPKEWCYPIVGCVAYRGYFVERRARAFGEDLRAKGFDVSVAGVAAYSTLGHFDDPILNTMIGWNDVELAAIIFHELTHQMIYIANDADFNEALATTVEEEGVRRWLETLNRSGDLDHYQLEQRRSLEIVTLLNRTRDELRTVYGSGTDSARMRERKQAAFVALRESYAHLVQGWGPHPPFENWFEKSDINNAHLASIATYYDCVPGFKRELAAVGGDLDAFYGRVRELAKLGQEKRDALVCGAR
ncbi:MAG: aminopeptidase [Steroidobacteraceae bacterium]